MYDSLIVNTYKSDLDSLTYQMEILQEQIRELQIGKNYFDIIIGSQIDIFVICLTMLTICLTLINFNAIFRVLPSLKNRISSLEQDLDSSIKSINSVKFNSNRAFFLGHLNRKNYDKALIASIRCMEYFIEKKEYKGVTEWPNETIKILSKSNPVHIDTFKHRYSVSAMKILDLALDLNKSKYITDDEAQEYEKFKPKIEKLKKDLLC